MMFDKPESEVNFLLSTNTDKKYDRSGDEARLACSLIQRGTVESFCSTNNENLSRCLNKIDKSKQVVIICHGSFSWRNQVLISNLASKLSTAMDVHTLRFDFTGNGHSSGEWKYNNVEQDYLDIRKVVDFVENGLHCEVICIMGHSLGSASVLQYAATNAIKEKDGEGKVSCYKYVNLAGRYYSPDEPLQYFSDDDMKQLKEQSYFYLKHPYEDRRVIKFKVTKEQVNKRSNRDSYQYIQQLQRTNSKIKVLTIHGSKDEMVPISSAYKFDDAIANHTLHVIDGANHNFNGVKYHDLMVNVISSFVDKR